MTWCPTAPRQALFCRIWPFGTLFAWGALAFVWLCLPGMESAWAQGKGWQRLQQQGFQVEIRASTRLSFLLRRDAKGRPILIGQLTDDRDKGIAGQTLQLTLPTGKRISIRTGAEGRFVQQTKGWPRRGIFRLSFTGAEGYAPSLRERRLDLRRVDLEINAIFPPPLASGSHRFEIRVRLSYKGQPLQRFPLTLYLGKPQAQDHTAPPNPKDMWPLMTLRSDRQGELRFIWEGRALEGPASLPLVLGYAGGEFFLPQRKLYRLIVLSPPHDSRSHWWWSVALLSVVLLGGGFFGFQFLWQFLRNRQEDLHHMPKKRLPIDLPPLADLGVGPPVKDDTLIAGWVLDSADRAPIANAYVVVERFTPTPKPQSTAEDGLRASPDSEGFQEMVIPEGEETDAIVVGAADEVAEEAATQPTKTKTDEYGRFILPFTAFGKVELRVYHTFYRAKRLTFQLPHQGKGRRLQLEITSYRELIYRLFVQGIQRLVPEKGIDPQRRTAREIIAEIDAPKDQQLQPLASLFEESYYGPAMPQAEQYTAAAEHLSELHEEPTPQANQPS